MAAFTERGSKNDVPWCRGSLAEIATECDAARALTGIDEALTGASKTEENRNDAFLHRLRGEILLERDPANTVPLSLTQLCDRNLNGRKRLYIAILSGQHLYRGNTMAELIYDVGAHQGEDTEFYLKKGFDVVAIEAIPEFCAGIRNRFEDAISSGRLKVLNLAVAQASGPVSFFIDEDVSVWGTTNPDWATRNRHMGGGRTRTISVEGRSLAEIMREHGVPHYCKIDIEGNDLLALKSLEGSPEVPQFVSLESEKRDWDRLIDEFSTLRALGYSRFQIIDQSLIELQESPDPAREGRACEHLFSHGSSGLFGEELPNRWLSLFEAIEAYRQIFMGYALNGDNGVFTRTPANLFRIGTALQTRLTRLKKGPGFRNPSYTFPSMGWYDTHAGRGKSPT